MPWWGWILLGAVLLGSELFVTTEFYLVFLGGAALLMGLSTATIDQPAWVQWLSFATLSAVLLVVFRRRIWRRFASASGDVDDPIVGENGTVSEHIAPGAQGRAELRGAVWTVRNVDSVALEPGTRVLAVELDGLVVLVRHAQ